MINLSEAKRDLFLDRKGDKEDFQLSDINVPFHIEVRTKYFGSSDANIELSFYFHRNDFKPIHRGIIRKLVQFKLVQAIEAFKKVKSWKRHVYNAPKKKIVKFKTDMPAFNKGMWLCDDYIIDFKEQKQKTRSKSDLSFMKDLTKLMRNKLLRYYDDIQIKVKYLGTVATIIINGE